ncbi:MAG: hypothetical protein NTY12_00435 [Candidatus Falkowbacteria bacterium]|nr:hypothetical protein [Candidatus Falkowbacteria bacterium]
MNFFLYQPELFYSINIIPGQIIGSISAILFFGGIFASILLFGFSLARLFKWPIKNIIIISALIAWLPLLFQFSYSSIIDFKNIYNFVDAPEEAQILWRYCSLDRNHGLGGGICGIYPFAQVSKKLIPAGASVKIFSTNIGIYLRYFLYNYFVVTNQDTADYFILYRSSKAFAFEDGKLYILEGNDRRYLGDFTMINRFDADTAIFKRVIK